MSEAPPRLVLLGVAGSGKTTVGRRVAAALDATFVDADDLHPPANVARMARGEPLDDQARDPWLTAVHQAIAAEVAAGRGFVLACSLLRQAYRERLQVGLRPLRWIHLAASAGTLRQRLGARRGHFFPPSLLDSQLAAWEPLPDGTAVDAEGEVAEVVAAVLAAAHR